MSASAADRNLLFGILAVQLDFINRDQLAGSPGMEDLTVNEGQYPVSRVLRLYTNKAKETAVALDFIQWVQSERGQKVVEEMGFVPRL